MFELIELYNHYELVIVYNQETKQLQYLELLSTFSLLWWIAVPFYEVFKRCFSQSTNN